MVLTAIQQYPTNAFSGMLEGLDDGRDVESWINNAGDVAGVTDLVITPLGSSHTYTFTAYGIPVSFTSSSGTASVIRDGLIAAVAAITALAPLITATASGNNVRITELNAENGPASVGNLDAQLAASVVTAHSQTEPMPAGIFVVGDGSGFQNLRLPRTSSLTHFKGAVMHQHAPINERLFPPPSTVLYPANHLIPVLKRGKMWMPSETILTLDAAVFMRFAAGAGGSQLGAARGDSDSGTAVSLSGIAKCVRPNTANGDLALIQVNLVP